MIDMLSRLPMVLRVIVSILLIPLTIGFVALIAGGEILSCILAIPITPLYIGKDSYHKNWKQINKINPFMIFNQEIMGWWD